MKGLKELLPSLYANEFKRLEEQLLKPAGKKTVETKTETTSAVKPQKIGKEEQRVSK